MMIALRASRGTPLAALVIGAALTPSAAPASTTTTTAAAPTTATIAPSLSPNRLGSRAALTYAIRFQGGELGVPHQLRRAVLQFPAGMRLELSSLHTCSRTRLRTRGARACPADSRLGSGHALAVARTGAQTLTEHLSLSAFLGPPHNLLPSVEILAQGRTPLDERVILNGEPFTGQAPYGEGLAIPIPTIPTLTLEPAASIVSFTLTIGRRSRSEAAVILPRRCPAAGFPFAARFTYRDGSSSSAQARTACPA